MAISSTIHKASLQISDMDRNYYAAHALTLAQHPSETEERMMMRLLCFALNAHEDLAFSRGLSSDDEPDLWRHSLSGDIEQWIDLGQADDKRIRKACGRASEVLIYTYQPRKAMLWWEQNGSNMARHKNLKVHHLQGDLGEKLAMLVQRSMDLQCTIEDRQIWLSNDKHSVEIQIIQWM